MVRVNMMGDTTSSTEYVKLVYMLATEMAADFNMPRNNFKDLVIDHLPRVCEWINEKYQTSVKHFDFGKLGQGIEFQEDSFLTAKLLLVSTWNNKGN